MKQKQIQISVGEEIASMFTDFFHHIHKTSFLARVITGVTTNYLNAYSYRIIGLLVNEGALPITEISLKLNIAKSNVSAFVNKEVVLGNLKRIPGQTDRRVVFVDATEKGAAKFDEAFSAMIKVYAEYFKRLTVCDQKALVKAVTSCSTILEKLYPPQIIFSYRKYSKKH